MALAAVLGNRKEPWAVLFQISNKQISSTPPVFATNLKTRYRSLEDSDNYVSADNNYIDGQVLWPGDLGVSQFNSQTHVFGFLKSPDGKQKAVAQLSPCINPVSTPDGLVLTDRDSLAASGNGSKQGFLYFTTGGTKHDSVNVISLDGNDPEGINELAASASPKSKLAACYYTLQGQGKSMVFWHSNLNNERVIRWSNGNNSNAIDATNPTPPDSRFAAVQLYPNGPVYLYYVISENLLAFVYTQDGGDNWSDLKTVEGVKIGPAIQIALIPHQVQDQKTKVYIIYEQNGKIISHAHQTDH